MRHPAPEKLEITRIVEQSHLAAKLTLDEPGIARRTFYRWFDRYLEGGPEALADKPTSPSRVWNRVPKVIHDQIIELALEQSELSRRELAVRFTDERRYFVSESTVYRLLKAHDLITNPAYVVVKAATEFNTKTTRPNEMWQSNFTYFKIIGWGWMYLPTVLATFRATSSLGGCAAICGPRMSPIRSTWPWQRRAATMQRSSTSPGCSATMVPATLRVNWPNTSKPTR
jgi:putative transposase